MTGVVAAETERLELREFSVDDAEGFFRLNGDPEVLRYTGDEPFADVEQARAFLAAYDNYARDGFGRWSVYLKETGEYLGFCGLNNRPATDEVDVGFRFRRACWDRGYATEAARAALDLGFTRYGLTRIVGRAMRDNAASHRVLEKLGMTKSHEFEQDGHVWAQYEARAGG
ncbi:MAG TPA: GNAT family N-acetyltransferase [Thermomicrobiales bacterium]|nr:GNAT family N-acetyltransferase [Thermomicrobiales bacterium]